MIYGLVVLSFCSGSQKLMASRNLSLSYCSYDKHWLLLSQGSLSGQTTGLELIHLTHFKKGEKKKKKLKSLHRQYA